MNDRIYRRANGRLNGRRIAELDGFDPYGSPPTLAEPAIQRLTPGAASGCHPMSGFDQSPNQVTPDEAVGPGHQYLHERRPLIDARANA
jgi:hypothetical protein